MELSTKVIEFGEKIENIGNVIGELGTTLLPYSFSAYIFFRFLFYILRIDFKYNNLLKSIWYLAHGAMLLTNDIAVDLMVTLIAFIEGTDLFVKHLEERRHSKEAS